MRRPAARGRSLVALVLLIAALVAPPAMASAQDTTSLEDIEELARSGRTEEARVGLLAWWETSRPDASRRDVQRALWLRGTLTVDPAQAASDYRRLVIEYPGGPFSDYALLRLAQAAHASGDGDAARVYVGTLTRDYPASPVVREAETWLAGAGPAPAPPLVDMDSVPSQPVAEARPIRPDPTPAAPTPEAVQDGPRFSVQLGAFANDDRARALYQRALREGLEPRMVRVEGTRLLHVRVGLFDSAALAGELLRRVGGMGFVAALVRDAQTEERIRR